MSFSSFYEYIHKQSTHTFGNRQGRRPLVSQNIETNGAIRVDVWMVNFGRKINLFCVSDKVCVVQNGKTLEQDIVPLVA